ncbi:hypothetical protein D3C71_1810270 [compost metagenome]
MLRSISSDTFPIPSTATLVTGSVRTRLLIEIDISTLRSRSEGPYVCTFEVAAGMRQVSVPM